MISTIFETTGTHEFAWFFYWGNFIFFTISIGQVLLIFLHSYYKGIKALAYRVLSLLLIIIIIPSLVFSFSSIELKTKLSNFILIFFILGMVGLVLSIIVSVIYFLISRSDLKGNYCEIHKTHYKETLCPVCVLDFELEANKEFDIDTRLNKDMNVKGFLINTANSKVFNLVSSNFIGRGRETNGVKKNVNIENDQFISRIHAKIIYDGRRFKLSDSSSNSGTFVNGSRIKGWVTLEDGDLIKIGKTFLKFTQK
ncbi:MAG: FHA domain-containing protein [Actinobacteria bacterium]|nr:FHA domain-containing protein [Actinomycetota bacterium]MBM3713466.1 FHA domain-containing protein [Actinomycetota bacterium]